MDFSWRCVVAVGLCCFLAQCTGGVNLGDQNSPSEQTSTQNDQTDSKVVPLPAAAKKYDTPTPVDTIVVDKNGNMTETQYTYDPNAGGVVINNYDEIGGPNASLYFPLFETGLLWWDGYWVDNDGYFWNGSDYVSVGGGGNWSDHWHDYWHHHWNKQWHQYYKHHSSDPQWRHNHHRYYKHHHQGPPRHTQPVRRSGSHHEEGHHGGEDHHGGGGKK